MDNKGLPLKGSLLLLLLMVSNPFLCRSVSSLPVCPTGSLNCEVSLQDLFERAVILSQYIYRLSTEMFYDFDKQYNQGQGFITTAISSCHTSTLPTPNNKEEALQIGHADLLQLVHSLLLSWNDPLYHLTTEVRGLQEAPANILTRATEIEARNKQLLEGIEKIARKVNPKIKENESYSVWSGLPAVQTDNEEARFFALYNLLRCLRRDSHKVDNYLKLLKCQVIYNNNC